jgi:hypothetical protein
MDVLTQLEIWNAACEAQKDIFKKQFNNTELYFKISAAPLASFTPLKEKETEDAK